MCQSSSGVGVGGEGGGGEAGVSLHIERATLKLDTQKIDMIPSCYYKDQEHF